MRAVKRLNCILELVNDSNLVVADIGADHGWLSKKLIEENRAKKVIATDISGKSLGKTRDLIKNTPLEKQIELRVGDGLNPIKPKEVDLVIIAGIGGYEIIKILENSKDKQISNFIFQPIQNTLQLREYLVGNNFEIIEDFVIMDKEKFYNTIKVVLKDNKQTISEEELLFGKTNLVDKSYDFRKYLQNFIQMQKIILKSKQDNRHIELLNIAERTLKELYDSKTN